MKRVALRIALGLAFAALTAMAGEVVRLTDIDGVDHGRLDSAPGRATAVFFILSDCPISNQLAPEINRICTDYSGRGVRCYLAYVDPEVSADGIRRHQRDFSYDCCTPLHDASRALTEAAGATITPEAAIFSPTGELLYRGRINDLYAGLGKKRREPTEHDVRRALDEILAGKAVSRPRTQAIGCYVPPKEL
ncbi:MAG: hypothetical protein GC160_29285 [Acidobacteria bacterium]|nr:hypothetical protein [Acidobacteriota bacterium]